MARRWLRRCFWRWLTRNREPRQPDLDPVDDVTVDVDVALAAALAHFEQFRQRMASWTFLGEPRRVRRQRVIGIPPFAPTEVQASLSDAAVGRSYLIELSQNIFGATRFHVSMVDGKTAEVLANWWGTLFEAADQDWWRSFV